MSTNNSDRDEISEGRRELLKAVAAAGGVVATRVLLPAAWSTPIIASMALPAHAATSNQNSEGEASSGDKVESGTGVDGAAISAEIDDETITLTITPPSSVFSGRTQFQVYERLEDTKVSPPKKFVRVIALMTPSADSAFSGSFTVELTRPPAKYDYQLRWVGGHTDWETFEVKA